MLDVQLEQREGATVLRLLGDVDLSTLSRLRGALEEAARRGPRVVLDCGGLNYIDSAGLRLLAVLHGRGLRPVLAAPSATLRRVLGIMALDTLFPAAGSVSEGLALLAERRPDLSSLDD